jgi:hypothetical protein
MMRTDARNDPLVFLQAIIRFAYLVGDAARSYGLKAEHILGGNNYRTGKVCLARMDLLQAIEKEYRLSLAQLAILFRMKHHTSFLLMRRRLQELPAEWRLPITK